MRLFVLSSFLQNIRQKIVATLFVSVVFFTLPAYSTVWYVDGDAPSGGDGRSWAEAFTNIQTAVNHATGMYMECMAPLDQIWVKEDVYHLSSQIQVNKVVGHIQVGIAIRVVIPPGCREPILRLAHASRLAAGHQPSRRVTLNRHGTDEHAVSPGQVLVP